MSRTVSRKDVERLLREAEECEARGDVDKAVALYRAASKLEPRVVRELEHSEAYDPLTYQRTPPADFRSFDAGGVLTDPEQQAAALRYFDEQGYIVVDNALSPEEVSKGLDLFSRFMTTAQECDMTKYADMKFNFIADGAIGIISKRGIGSSSFAWHARSRRNVKDLFRLFLFGAVPAAAEASPSLQRFDDRKLISSFDGANMMKNPDASEDFTSAASPWFHFDAGDDHSGRYVQGLVNFLDCTATEDPGLVVLPRSHRTLFPHIVPRTDPSPAYLTYLGPVEDRARAMLGIPHDAAYRVPAAAGSLVLWKSSVLHCNTGCQRRFPGAPCDPSLPLVRRVCAYVCMMPDPADAEVTENRLELFRGGRTSTHQPDLCRWVGDVPKADSVSAGDVINRLDALPEGAEELL